MGSRSKADQNQNITDASSNAGTESAANSGAGNLTYAGAGALVADNGGAIVIEDLSDDVALGAIAGMSDTAARAFAANRDVTTGALDFGGRALNSNGQVVNAALEYARDTQAMAYRENADSRSAATLATQNSASLANALSTLAVDNVAESRRDPDNQLLTTLAKYGAYAVAAVVALFLIFTATRKKS